MTTAVRESKVERDIVQYAERRGWLVYKFTAVNKRGVPDRVLMRNGSVIFIEVKRPGETASGQQLLRIADIEAKGVACYVFDNLEAAKHVLI